MHFDTVQLGQSSIANVANVGLEHFTNVDPSLFGGAAFGRSRRLGVFVHVHG